MEILTNFAKVFFNNNLNGAVLSRSFVKFVNFFHIEIYKVNFGVSSKLVNLPSFISKSLQSRKKNSKM